MGKQRFNRENITKPLQINVRKIDLLPTFFSHSIHLYKLNKEQYKFLLKTNSHY